MRYFITLILTTVVALACSEKPAVPEEAPGDAAIPELPADPHPEKTSFAHRILLLQHTGTYCPACPTLMMSLKKLAEDGNYADKYHHVAAHSYNESGDLAYSSAAENLSQAFCSGYYPELTFNLTKENTGASVDVDVIRSNIDELHQQSAYAGIRASVRLTGRTLGMNIGIKAAAEKQYRIAAWVLEDGIRSRQEGATEDWMNTHNNAVRAMAGSTLNLRIYGEKTGILKSGESAEQSFTVTLEEGWNAERCKVLIVVNAAGEDGRYDLVNCSLCPIGESITYDYI